MVDTNLRVILQQLEAEKSVDRATLIEAIRSAIESAMLRQKVKWLDGQPNARLSAFVKVPKTPDAVQTVSSRLDVNSPGRGFSSAARSFSSTTGSLPAGSMGVIDETT